MSVATKIPSNNPKTGSPPGPIGCSIRSPIKYPINAVRNMPTIARINEALSGTSNGSANKIPSINFCKFGFKALCGNN